MYLEIFLADFAVFRVLGEFRWISWKYLTFAGPRPREISEALITIETIEILLTLEDELWD